MAVALLSAVSLIVTGASGKALDRESLFIGYSEQLSRHGTTDRGGTLVLNTKEGKAEVQLMRSNAPHTCSAVLKAASAGAECSNCRFYRNEARPERGSLGPPYGLLQGSMALLDGNFPREGNIVARRGHVCSIPATKEFFIATSDHSEWGTAHSCWGEVDDLAAVERIIAAPYRNYTHPDYGTIMRMLVAEVPFQIHVSAS